MKVLLDDDGFVMELIGSYRDERGFTADIYSFLDIERVVYKDANGDIVKKASVFYIKFDDGTFNTLACYSKGKKEGLLMSRKAFAKKFSVEEG